ncbi:MAG: TrkA family potassium uptake protein, partial [Ectothiorhodospiraceae bacterium]
EARVNALADELSHVVITDVKDERAVDDLGLDDYDAVVIAIGEDLESNILSTLAVKSLGGPKVWVKAQTPSHHRILVRLGADRIIHPEHEMGMEVANSLNYPYVLAYISLGNDYFVVEVEATEALDGKPLSELELKNRHSIRYLALKRGREPLWDEPTDITLKEGDRLVLLGHLNDLRRFGAEL